MIPRRPETFKITEASTREEQQAARKECAMPGSDLPQPVSPTTQPPNIIEAADERTGTSFLQLPPKQQLAVFGRIRNGTDSKQRRPIE